MRSFANAILRIILFRSIVAAFIPKWPCTKCSTLLGASPQGNADFEYQELKILSQALVDQGVTNSKIPADKRVEIEGYCRRLINLRSGSIAPENIPSVLAGTSWQLAFSTQSLVSESLPPGTNIKLKFKSDDRLDYTLEFTKTLGLKQLVADSSYIIDVSEKTAKSPNCRSTSNRTFFLFSYAHQYSPINASGMISYTYEGIRCDVFGLTNINIGAFGLLKGRCSSIQTSFFDGSLLIEQNNDIAGEFFNVYTRI